VLFSETDFIAKTDAFQQLGKDIAMHIAATNPLAIDRTEFPADVIAKEREIFVEQVKALGKPDNVVEKIVEGKVDKFYQDNCLLEQAFVKDPSMTVDILIKHLIGKVGENIRVGSFSRIHIGS
jgi:elongation factor Ts